MNSYIYWLIFSYLLGSIPFSVWLSRLAGKDVRSMGDGNPGAFNAFLAGGRWIGAAAMFFDILKGLLPVYLARLAGFSGWQLTPIMIAPAFGHAFSPFLKFRGGKALASTGGAWMGVIGVFQALAVFGTLAIPAIVIQEENSYAGMAGMIAFLGYALFFDGSSWLITAAVIHLLLITWTHRKSLGQSIQPKPWVANLLTRRSV